MRLGYVGQAITFVLSVRSASHSRSGRSGVCCACSDWRQPTRPYLGLGTLQAAERLIAIEIGRGNDDAADDLQAAAAAILGLVSGGLAAVSDRAARDDPYPIRPAPDDHRLSPRS